MAKFQSNLQKRIRRHTRVRARVVGTHTRPRLSVFRSNRHMWVQLIDDTKGKTIVAASDREQQKKGQKVKDKKVDVAYRIGEEIAKLAIQKKLHSVVFDRGGYKYHGMVKAVAEGARKGGLKF
jgi:large subunit ribosomal protein L18